MFSYAHCRIARKCLPAYWKLYWFVNLSIKLTHRLLSVPSMHTHLLDFNYGEKQASEYQGLVRHILPHRCYSYQMNLRKVWTSASTCETTEIQGLQLFACAVLRTHEDRSKENHRFSTVAGGQFRHEQDNINLFDQASKLLTASPLIDPFEVHAVIACWWNSHVHAWALYYITRPADMSDYFSQPLPHAIPEASPMHRPAKGQPLNAPSIYCQIMKSRQVPKHGGLRQTFLFILLLETRTRSTSFPSNIIAFSAQLKAA